MYFKTSLLGIVLGLFLISNHINAQTALSDNCGDINAATTLPLNDCSSSQFRVNTTNWSGEPLGTCSNAIGASRRDGWAGFTSPSGGDNRVVVQYNHTPPAITNTALTVYNDCASAEVGTEITANTESAFNISQSITPTPLDYGGVNVTVYREGWVRYTAQPGEKFSITYSNTNQNAAIAVLQGGCPGTGAYVALRNDVNGVGTEEITLTNNLGTTQTYDIRIINAQSDSPMAGTLRVRQHNALLMVYRGTCGALELLGCSVSDNDGTQSITFNAAPSTDYFVRVVNLFSTANMDGNLCVFSGPSQPGDLCNEAQEVSIGTCDYQIEVFSSFFNNENIPNPPTCGITDIFRDGWARFEVSSLNQRIGIEYQSTVTDVALAVYSGSCSDLTLITCANNDNTAGADQKEYIEFSAPSVGTYYVRIMNIENTQTVVGKLCVYDVIPRNNCADAVSAATSLTLGDCNVKANISSDFTSSGGSACAADNHDIWLKYTHTDASVVSVQVEYIADGLNTVYNPSMIVYNAASLDCADLAGSTNIFCASSTLPSNTLVTSFAVTSGQTYYIRIINQEGNDMIGNICIYDQGKKAEDNFYTALEYQIDGTDCGNQFNILSTFNSTGGASLQNPSSVSCATELSKIDAWAKFQTGAALPTSDLVIEYNNDNQDAEVADNAALVVYKGSPINTPVNPAPGGQVSTTSEGVTTDLAFDTFYEGINLSFEVWSRVNVITPGTYSLIFETESSDVGISIYDNTATVLQGSFGSNSPGEKAEVTFASAGVYYIQVANLGAPLTDGRLAVLSPMTEVACANSISEGTEGITLTSTTPNFDPNSTYYIRVINLESSNSLVGTLCIRNGGVRPEDLCSTARQLVVGDCDILFDLDESELPDDQPLTPTCIGSKTMQSDAWASFTANTSQTTLEYFISGNTGKDAAIEIYRGSCSGLISVACADALGQIDGVESVAFNTLVGQTYYIRIMNVGTSGDMSGRICLFDTRERDVCDDQDIITLTPDACNVRFNVPATFQNTGADPNSGGSCSAITFGSDARDAWVRFLGDGTTMTLQYQNGEVTSDPMFMIYTANPGPINCGIGINGAGNNTNEIACANVYPTGQQTESISIPTQAGKLYILRVIDLNAGNMTGTLCLFSGETGAEDCASARVIDIRSTLGSPDDVGACNIQFNVLNTNTASNPTNDCGIGNEGDAWATFTTGLGGIFPLPADNITVQYDNNDNNFTIAPDMALEVYRANGTFDCNNPTTYTLISCIDTEVEGVESLNFPIDDAGSETYYIRVISKNATKTIFGKLCIFFGPSIAQPTCATTLDYGPLDGTYKGFEVASTWTDRRPQDRIEDPACVIPNGSNPSSPNPPIVSNGWVRFSVPINANPDLQVNAVTVQFDNTRFSSTDLNSENAAIAVYRLLPPNTPTSINGNNDACTLTNLELVDCANNVWRGTESVTISVVPGGDYLVRVMNVKNSGKDMPGLIRVFEFTRCELQGELVVDGNFANWKALNTASNPEPASFAGMNDWIHENPDIKRYNQHGSDQENIDFYARFATDYGYLRDRSGGSGGDPNRQGRLFARKGEFNPEGLYSVTHSINNYKSNWFSYGNGEVGYGGGNSWNFSAAYCATGGNGAGSEACEGFGVPQAGLPALIPSSAEANFMAVNGWWKRPSDYPNQEAGKIWCQTIDISANAGQPNRYYVFTAWFNNVKSIKQSGDVPKLRITVCDMEDVNNPGVLPTIGETSSTAASRLPGTTYTSGIYTQHIPEPPNNANMRKAAPLGFAFGAAMPCNTDGEAPNSRLKELGSDFFLPQEPDQWQVVRCIYRAPQDVTELNLCLENLSLSKNGNDFAIDDISFQQCSSTNEAALDALLRGDACELADEPEALSIPLSMRMLDFGGKLVNNKVLLSWLVLNENNLATYEVQRSTDGANFYAVGEVEARGELNELLSYDFVDYQLPEGKSVIYYRLRMIGINGNDELGAIIQVNIEDLQNLEMVLYPNPIQAGDDFKVSFKAFGDLAGIKINDMMGNAKVNKIIATQDGKNELTFSSKGFAPGLYIIQLKVGNQQVSRKLVIM